MHWNTMFYIKALIPSYPPHRPGTSQTAGCASEPSGVHPLSCPCNLVNTFQMSLIEIMCGLGRRGYRQLLLSPVRKTLSAKDTPLLPQPQHPSLYLYWVGEGGDAVRYATWLKERKSRLQNFAPELQNSLFSPLLQRELLYYTEVTMVTDFPWLKAEGVTLHKPIKVL